MAYGGSRPPNPEFLLLAQKKPKGHSSNAGRAHYGSLKLAPNGAQRKISVSTETTVSPRDKLNFSFFAWLEEYFIDPYSLPDKPSYRTGLVLCDKFLFPDTSFFQILPVIDKTRYPLDFLTMVSKPV